MHQPRRQIFYNVLSNWVSYAFGTVIAIFLSPYVVHRLGSTSYGVWTLVVSLVGYLGLLDFGVRGAVTRYIAKFHGQADNQSTSRLVSSALGIFALIGCLAILIAMLISFYADK